MSTVTREQALEQMSKQIEKFDTDELLEVHNEVFPDNPSTLEEAEKDPALRSDPDAASKDGGTLLEQWLDARHLAYPPVPAKPYKRLAAVCPLTQ